MKKVVFAIFCLSFFLAKGQYSFSGNVSVENSGKPVYLSMVEDYRKSSRVYLNQIIRKVTVDSTGFFQFKGNNIPEENRMYRIHLDNCSEDSENTHFLRSCSYSSSILFIANNSDIIQFPTSFENQALCTIESTNPKSQLLLDIEGLKEKMIFDFIDYHSDTNLKLNSKKWFAQLQEFGASMDEPLAELYIFDFLSDKRNETYGFYLQDVLQNPYYEHILVRLQDQYPNTGFTKQYQAEIIADKQLASFKDNSPLKWKWILGIALAISLFCNVIFLLKRQKRVKSNSLFEKLTPQEQKIVNYIKAGKSNKEIASSLFVSLSTVKTHINNLYKKLDVSNREDIMDLLKD